MLTFSLQSGSNGNCIYVEAGAARLLFDAGISGRQAEVRLAARGRNIRECSALILSHDHGDHSACAGTYNRKYRLPVYMTRNVYRALRPRLGKVEPPRWFEPGDCLDVNGVKVHTISTPHDGIDTVCFVVEHEGKRLGIFNDLGSPFLALGDALGACDAAYLESNHDSAMLAGGSYPELLKRRIAGQAGHLSNHEAADLVRSHAAPRLQWLALAHLSAENNSPAVALETHHKRGGMLLPLLVASRQGPSEILHV